MKSKRKIRQINDQTIAFMNLVENFSRTSSDIAEVCDKAAFYMNEPLKSIIGDFVADMRIYGDSTKAFDRVLKKLEGSKLYEIFKSLEICERHEGNFAEIVEDSKRSVREFEKSISLRRAIIANARGDLLALLFAGILVFQMLDDFLSAGVAAVLLTSPIGIAIIGYLCICLLMIGGIILKGD